MKKIIWESPSPILYESFSNKKMLNNISGGHAYNFQACMALKSDFNISIDAQVVRRKQESIIPYLWRIARHKTDADLIIKDGLMIILGKNRASHKIGMIHHLADEIKNSSLKYRWYFHLLEKRIRQLDYVITVSKYWEQRIQDLGCKNTKVIYNSFDLTEFQFSETEIAEFKEKYQLNSDKPLIYIGNAKADKGVIDVYNALGNEKFHLIMSGPKNNKLSLPVHHLYLERQDYLCLLRACDLVLTMSTMMEGWNRTAHEAMLCKTPVIGTGIGGMKELLTEGRQVIQPNYQGLTDTVLSVLENKEQLAQDGFKYVKQFNLDYFNTEWLEFIKLILR
jgi:glycosyltransferase involved in cell wall biosynthesis